MTIKQKILASLFLCALPAAASGQQILSIEQCREMAVSNNRKLEQERIKVEMAGYDRKIARANYYPDISGTGAYMYRDKEISLISDDMSDKLTHAGDIAQGSMNEFMGNLQQAIISNPAAAAEYMQSPLWQTVIGTLGQTDISAALNQLGTELDDAFHLVGNATGSICGNTKVYISYDVYALSVEKIGAGAEQVPSCEAAHILKQGFVEHKLIVGFLKVTTAIDTVYYSVENAHAEEQERIGDKFIERRDIKHVDNDKFHCHIEDAHVGIDAHLLMSNDHCIIGYTDEVDYKRQKGEL